MEGVSVPLVLPETLKAIMELALSAAHFSGVTFLIVPCPML